TRHRTRPVRRPSDDRPLRVQALLLRRGRRTRGLYGFEGHSLGHRARTRRAGSHRIAVGALRTTPRQPAVVPPTRSVSVVRNRDAPGFLTIVFTRRCRARSAFNDTTLN